jgi:hypothetical protein
VCPAFVEAQSGTGMGEPVVGPAASARRDAEQAVALSRSQVRGRMLAVYGPAALGLALYANKNWWNEGFTGKFRTIDEGWFGQNTADGGADKLGHAILTTPALLARGFEWANGDGQTSQVCA